MSLNKGINELRAWGEVGTPPEVVEKMVVWADIKDCHNLNILEPACGEAPFISCIHNKYRQNKHSYTGVEINPDRKIQPDIQNLLRLVNQDYLLWNAAESFDLVIGNPPYGIIGDAVQYPIHILKQFKAQYKKIFLTWRGKYNIYGAFLEKSVNLLKRDGKLVFIIPGTWLLLDDFIELRRFLAAQGRLRIHYMGSAFPKRNVVAVVLIFTKGGKGLELREGDRHFRSWEDYSGEVISFDSMETEGFRQDKIGLGEFFSFHFAARSPEFKKHPEVRKFSEDGLVPVLTGRNLKPNWIDYDNNYSGFWMPLASASKLRAFYGIPHIVIGHTKGGRVVAAIDAQCYPWREEIHLVPKNNEYQIDAEALVEYLNSRELNEYCKALYRDLIPHLTITQLKILPVPLGLIKNN